MTGDALNYVEAKAEDNPHLTWTSLSKLLSERYNNINREKEVSDRLYSMKYEEFHAKAESPATTLDRITAHIDKLAVLTLSVDRTDEAKARSVSHVTRGQIWAYHAKGIIAPTTSYDRVFQAFATSIRDRAVLESGRDEKGAYSKKGSYRRGELYKTNKVNRGDFSTDENIDDEIFLTNSSADSSITDNCVTALETFFGSARFANHPRTVKPFSGTIIHNHTRNKYRGNKQKRPNFNHSACSNSSSVGCFNCGRQGCSVATCTKPRDSDRIAKNISR